MHILYYITSHGYGHGVRSCRIAESLPKNLHITFRTMLPQQLFNEELTKPFSYYPGEFDCGCLQTDGVTTNAAATLQRYEFIAQRNKALLKDELEWCRENNVQGILSDITPFAFEVAHELKLPSVAITNFTWYDIYQEYVYDQPSFEPILDEIKKQYSYADAVIALYPSLKMDYFKKIYPVQIVGRKGNSIREKIRQKFNFPEAKKIGLIYVGNFGMDKAIWGKLSTFTDWEFLGVYPIPTNASNYHQIKKEDFAYQDLVASVDVMIAKLGYGSMSECMINGKPIIYLPRHLFAEHPCLEQAVNKWGGGIILSEDSFYSLDWKGALDRAINISLTPMESNGTMQSVKIIESVLNRTLPAYDL